METDDMYLDNLDEFINDENKIVTYKWLSRTLSVHVNKSKQMLYSFVQVQRNKKNNDHLNVLYLVAGLSKEDDFGIKTHKVQIIPEENLEPVKQSLVSVTSCHIYSVHKSQIKDSSALYQADYELTKGQSASQFSAITCTEAKPRSASEKPRQTAVSETEIEKKNESQSSTNGNERSTKSNTSAKSSKSGGLQAMFAAQKTQSKSKNGTSVTHSEKKEESKPAKTSNSSKPSGVMSFFANHATKPKEPKNEPAESSTAAREDKEQAPQTKTQPPKGSRKKKANDRSDEDENPVPQQKKRRRIRAAQIESSSDEDEASNGEEMDVEIEEPIPSPVPDSPIPSPVASPEKTTLKEKDDPNANLVHKKNGRRRRRKLVAKTSIDDDGFMVTEKVWESDSTDVSDEEPIPKPPQSKPAQSEVISKEKTLPQKKQISPNKTKPKQASLMSFFKKK